MRQREQEDAAERKKVLELQKQMAEEREQERFEELQERSGLKTREATARQKLSWMYRGPQQTAEERAQEAEAVLLGEKQAQLKADAEDQEAKANAKNVVGSLWMQAQASEQNEDFHLRHEDPMFAMMQQERTEDYRSASKTSSCTSAREVERGRRKGGESVGEKRDSRDRHRDEKRRRRSDHRKDYRREDEGSRRKRRKSSSHRRRHDDSESDSDSDSDSDSESGSSISGRSSGSRRGSELDQEESRKRRKRHSSSRRRKSKKSKSSKNKKKRSRSSEDESGKEEGRRDKDRKHKHRKHKSSRTSSSRHRDRGEGEDGGDGDTSRSSDEGGSRRESRDRKHRHKSSYSSSSRHHHHKKSSRSRSRYYSDESGDDGRRDIRKDQDNDLEKKREEQHQDRGQSLGGRSQEHLTTRHDEEKSGQSQSQNGPPKLPGYGLQLTGPRAHGPARPPSNDDDSLGPSAEMIASRAEYLQRMKEKHEGKRFDLAEASVHAKSPVSSSSNDDRLARLEAMQRAGQKNEELRKQELEAFRKTREAEAAEEQKPIQKLDSSRTATLIKSDFNANSSLEARLRTKRNPTDPS